MGTTLESLYSSASIITLAIAIVVIGAYFGSSSSFLAVCLAISPSWTSKGKSIVSGGTSSRLKEDIEELISNADKLRKDLNNRGGRSLMKKTSNSLVQANDIVGNVSTIAKYFKALHKKANEATVAAKEKTPVFIEMCSDIALHTPVIGVTFAILQPLLQAFVDSKKIDQQVVDTSKCITKLLEEVDYIIKQTETDQVDLTPAENSDIHSLVLILEEGLNLVVEIMGGREKSIFDRVFRNGDHRGQLQSWLDETTQFLETKQRQNITLLSIRGRYIKETVEDIVETQRRYFAFLKFSSVLIIVILTLVAHGVFFIIIPLLEKDALEKDALPDLLFKWVADSLRATLILKE